MKHAASRQVISTGIGSRPFRNRYAHDERPLEPFRLDHPCRVHVRALQARIVLRIRREPICAAVLDARETREVHEFVRELAHDLVRARPERAGQGRRDDPVLSRLCGSSNPSGVSGPRSVHLVPVVPGAFDRTIDDVHGITAIEQGLQLDRLIRNLRQAPDAEPGLDRDCDAVRSQAERSRSIVARQQRAHEDRSDAPVPDRSHAEGAPTRTDSAVSSLRRRQSRESHCPSCLGKCIRPDVRPRPWFLAVTCEPLGEGAEVVCWARTVGSRLHASASPPVEVREHVGEAPQVARGGRGP